MKFFIKQKYNKNIRTHSFISGFTLIEVMVAVSIFTIVMTISMGAIFSIVNANKKAQALNAVINSLNFSIEAMVRDLRTGYSYACLGDYGSPNCSGGGNSVSFTSTQLEGQKVDYALVLRCRSGSTFGCITKSVDDAPATILTSPDVDIQDLKFYVENTTKTNAGDYLQPKILVIIKGEGHVAGAGTTPFSLETLVSQRRTDI